MKKKIGIVDTKIHDTVTIIEPVNLYSCKLSKGVFIGPFVEIQNDVEIGSNTKIQSHTFICSMVKIGENCFVGHGVMFVNDRFSDGAPAGGDKTKWEKTLISDRVNIGSNATILPVNICSDVTIGAGSVVTKDILVPGKYAGNPATHIG